MRSYAEPSNWPSFRLWKRGRESFLDEHSYHAIGAFFKCRADLAFPQVV